MIHNSFFSIAGLIVNLASQRSEDVELVPSLKPFSVEPTEPDIRIKVEWVARLDEDLRTSLFDSGANWRLYEDDGEFQFDICAPVFSKDPYKRLLIDSRFREAALQVSQESFETFPLLCGAWITR
jgi:hypothetical protein